MGGSMMNKVDMLAGGRLLAQAWCALNDMPVPDVVVVPSKEWHFGSTCAYYRNHVTTICVERCASIGVAGPAWSYPGYSVDRTPYGVIQHELGHHVDWLRSTRRGPYFGDFSIAMRKSSGEKPLTSYCPNDAEWFAEMFRLFVTNPDLLRILRPRTHDEMVYHFRPVTDSNWREVLRNAPERNIQAIERKIVVDGAVN